MQHAIHTLYLLALTGTNKIFVLGSIISSAIFSVPELLKAFHLEIHALVLSVVVFVAKALIGGLISLLIKLFFDRLFSNTKKGGANE